MKIKLTRRGRLVVSILLLVGVILACMFSIWLVNEVRTYDYDSVTKPPQIECVAGTVLQADGSCQSMEN